MTLNGTFLHVDTNSHTQPEIGIKLDPLPATQKSILVNINGKPSDAFGQDFVRHNAGFMGLAISKWNYWINQHNGNSTRGISVWMKNLKVNWSRANVVCIDAHFKYNLFCGLINICPLNSYFSLAFLNSFFPSVLLLVFNSGVIAKVCDSATRLLTKSSSSPTAPED